MRKSKNRHSKKHKEWIKRVLERDKYKCQKCFTDKKLVAHHIVPWNKNEKLRFVLKNGQTLCIGCHMRHHKNHKGKKQIAWNKGKKTGLAPWKGKKFSKEHKDKLSKAKKNCHPWNIGIPMKASTKKIQSQQRKGKKWIIDPLTGKRKWID